MRWKRPFFALVTVLVFFLIVEAGLWLAGVPTLMAERDPFQGFSDQVRVFELDEAVGVYRTPRRATLHSFNYQEFLAAKPENGFRLFVLGGSSAYGFPRGARQAFPDLLGDALQAALPDRRVEVINAAAMSYGSHRLRILARELLDYAPDALVIYGGHNEFIETRFYHELLERSVQLDRLRGWLYRWRLYSLLTRLFEERATAETDPEKRSAAELLGLDVVREYPREVADAEKEEARSRFGDNLRAIIAMARGAGVPVVLCTVPSNTSGWAPNHSVFAAGVNAEERRAVLQALGEARRSLERGQAVAAVDALEPARELAPEHAEVLFRLGQAFEALERWEQARGVFVLARDADARPSRAPTSLNETIRRLATELGTLLVDVERAFERRAPHGLLGFELFEDYVHPKPEGHRLIALELWKRILADGLLGESRPADDDAFDDALARGRAEPQRAPRDDAKSPALLFNLAVVLENQGRFDEAMENYRACLALHPGYYVARANLARLLAKQGRDAEAAQQHLLALEVEPSYVRSMLGLGESLRRMGRIEEALEVLERAIQTDPASAPAQRLKGLTLLQLQRLAPAEESLREAVRIDPQDADSQVGLGYCLLYQAKLDEALLAFRAGLALTPGHQRGRNGMAAVLTEQGELDEAERLFRESLRLDPDDAFARVGLEEIEKRR
jgi:tetratricopeptide (TPR) repeat protein